MPEVPFKSGYLFQKQNPLDWEYGSGTMYTPLESNIVNPEGLWKTPTPESQNKYGYDRMACVTYSLMNVFEMKIMFAENREPNFSDRYIAALSGTTHQGNSQVRVFDAVRDYGLVDEADYPDTDKGWDDYYKIVPDDVKEKGKKFKEGYEIYYEWVPTYKKDVIFAALKESPLQVIVEWADGEGNLNPGTAYNHSVSCYGAVYGDHWKIFDHYNRTTKKYAWDYEFAQILKPTLIKKTNNPMNLANNTLVFKTQGTGNNFAIALDGKLIVDEVSKILAVWTMRTNDFNLKKSITLADWDKFPKEDLKGNKI